MKGKLKNGDFFVGNKNAFSAPKGKIVTIIDTEDHFIYGKRYKILGYNEWFEANCFEYVEE